LGVARCGNSAIKRTALVSGLAGFKAGSESASSHAASFPGRRFCGQIRQVGRFHPGIQIHSRQHRYDAERHSIVVLTDQCEQEIVEFGSKRGNRGGRCHINLRNLLAVVYPTSDAARRYAGAPRRGDLGTATH
jgi:hypothetical protein